MATGNVTVQHVLLVYIDERDDAAFDQALEVAARFRARLTIAVPILEPSPLCGLAGVSPERLRAEIIQAADERARSVVERVPLNVSVEYRLVPRGSAQHAVHAELRSGQFDLCLSRSRRNRPGWWQGLRRMRLWQAAHAVNRAAAATSVVADDAVI